MNKKYIYYSFRQKVIYNEKLDDYLEKNYTILLEKAKKRKSTIGTNTNKRQYKKKEINNIENNTKIDNNNENISDEELAELLSTLK